MGTFDAAAKTQMFVSSAKAAITSTETGASKDVSDFRGACAVIDAGAWTDGTHTFKLQDSDDNSTWTDVAATDLSGSFSAISSGDNDNAQQYVGYKGIKKYLRLVNTVSGATTGLVVGMYIVLADPREIPQN